MNNKAKSGFRCDQCSGMYEILSFKNQIWLCEYCLEGKPVAVPEEIDDDITKKIIYG